MRWRPILALARISTQVSDTFVFATGASVSASRTWPTTTDGPTPAMVSTWMGPHTRRMNVGADGVANTTAIVESAATERGGEAMLSPSESRSGWKIPIRYFPGGTESTRNRPVESVMARVLSPSTETCAPLSAPPWRLSTTMPTIAPIVDGVPDGALAGAARWDG